MNKTIKRAAGLGLAAAAVLLGTSVCSAKGWDAKYMAALPNTAFASVEALGNGEFARHLPYRDSSGEVDIPHLKAALREWSRVKWQDQANAKAALDQLKNVKQGLCAAGKMKCAAAKPKKPKQAKLKVKKIKKTAAKGTKPAGRKPRVAAGPKPGKGPKHPRIAKGAKPASKVARTPSAARAVKAPPTKAA